MQSKSPFQLDLNFKQLVERPLFLYSSLCLGLFVFFKSICSVYGAGLVIPDNGSIATARGGASVSGIHDPTAGFLNPSLLSRLGGLRISYNHNLILSDISFTRSPSVIPDNYDYNQYPEAIGVGQGTSENETPLFPLNGLLAVSYQLESGTTLGFSVHGPNGSGASKYPTQGAQRYMMTELDGILGFVGASIATGGSDWGIGTTLQWAVMTNMSYRLVVDGAASKTLNPNVNGLDVEAELNVKDQAAFTAIIGAWYRPINQFEIAFSSRILPVHFNARGNVNVFNTPNQTVFGQDQLNIADGSAAFDFSLPRTARLALRYFDLDDQGVETYDIELAVVYEGWSVMDELNVRLQGYVPALGADLEDVIISKRWRDTVSVRLGGSLALNSDFKLLSGLFFEQGATPRQYANIDFPSYDRWGGSVGMSYQFNETLQLVVGYLHIFQHQVEVDEYEAKVFQQRPIAPCPEGCGMDDTGTSYSGVPANAGIHRVSLRSFTLGVNTSF